MKLVDFLQKKRNAILKQWMEKVQNTYPSDAANFLRNKKDRFQNPVGHTISHDLGDLFSALLGVKFDLDGKSDFDRNSGSDRESDLDRKTGEERIPVLELAPLIEYFIKIRSIQEFTPSQAVGFVFQLKASVRENLRNEIEDATIAKDLLAFESRLDDVALLTFDMYMNCREKLFELKLNQRQQGPLRMVSKPILSRRKNNEKDRKNGET